jgi:hypothetical protein
MELHCKKSGWLFVETNRYAFVGVLQEVSILEISLKYAVKFYLIKPGPENFIFDGPGTEAKKEAFALGEVGLPFSNIDHYVVIEGDSPLANYCRSANQEREKREEKMKKLKRD